MTPYAYRLTVAAMRPNARFWHEAAKSRMSAQRSLLEGKRTCRGHRKNDVLDPIQTFAQVLRCKTTEVQPAGRNFADRETNGSNFY